MNGLDRLCRLILVLEAARASQGPLEAAALLSRAQHRDDAATDLFEDAVNLPRKPFVLKGLRNARLTPEQLENERRRF